MPECENCNDELWVCEAHDDQSMDHTLSDGNRCGGAGMPCPACNVGLERGVGNLFDAKDAVASDTPVQSDDIPWSQ